MVSQGIDRSKTSFDGWTRSRSNGTLVSRRCYLQLCAAELLWFLIFVLLACLFANSSREGCGDTTDLGDQGGEEGASIRGGKGLPAPWEVAIALL